MNIWAIADLHLCLSNTDKTMEVFGDNWKDYIQRIKKNWEEKVLPTDLVLIAGDISWAKNFQGSLVDFEFIEKLPGKKVIIKGNHDYWWPSLKKMQENLPPSIHVIQNNSFNIDEVSIAGARLWDTDEYNFNEITVFKENPFKNESRELDIQENERIFKRDIERLKLSLYSLNEKAKVKIVMTHYPPIGLNMKDSICSKLFEEFNIDIVIFGHLHNLNTHKKLFSEKNGIKYFLTSSDYLNFSPIKIL